MAERASVDDPFYVGYFPLPAKHRRVLKVWLPLALLAVTGLGFLLAAGQKDPGTGQWETDKEVTLVGVVNVEPYAILRTPDGDGLRSVLLVEEGKFGAAERLKSFNGQVMKLRGTLLHRAGRNLLEISAAPDAVSMADALGDRPRAPLLPVEMHGEQTLRGEIIDPKRYIGAMKPGGGKTHKACAELCLAGGIPPMLAARDASGHEVFYCLMMADGSAANAAASPLAGETVTLTGTVTKQDDLLILRVEGFP